MHFTTSKNLKKWDYLEIVGEWFNVTNKMKREQLGNFSANQERNNGDFISGSKCGVEVKGRD